MEFLFVISPLWEITVVRIVLGIIFFAHGAQKVLYLSNHGLILLLNYFETTEKFSQVLACGQRPPRAFMERTEDNFVLDDSAAAND